MVGSGRRHRAAGPIPEGRPSGPRPSAVSRTTGSEAPRWPDLHADATQPSVVARAAAVARGAIAGASALLSSLEASSAVTLSSRDWMAAALLLAAAVFTARSVT